MTIAPALYRPDWLPRRVLLFSGHMIDRDERAKPRFPEAMTEIAAEQIAKTLNQLGADHHDLALTQGACGGDLLFAAACLQRGVQLQLLQPFAEAEFIERSVRPGGDSWLERYRRVRESLLQPPLSAPVQSDQPSSGMNAYQRCNLWLLNTARQYGPERLILLCLWDGEAGNGPGGTAHMIEHARHMHARIIWLDTRSLLESMATNTTTLN